VSDQLDGRDVLVSEQIGPAIVGVVKPEIVIPRWALGLPAQDRELVLRHEEEHRRAGDLRVVVGSLVVLALLPWNVPLWWQVRRLRLAVELDCDRRVLAGAHQLRRYASLLVEMGRRRTISRLAALALAYPAPFLERRILSMTARVRPTPARTAAFAIVASLLALAAYRVEAPAAQLDVASSRSIPTPAAAPAQRVARIMGRVTARDTGAPLNDVQVTIAVPGAPLNTLSSANGGYAISNVPPGSYTVRAARLGLTSATRQINVTGGDVVEVDLEMSTYTVGMPEKSALPTAPRP
jgi:hypothetical protein